MSYSKSGKQVVQSVVGLNASDRNVKSGKRRGNSLPNVGLAEHLYLLSILPLSLLPVPLVKRKRHHIA